MVVEHRSASHVEFLDRDGNGPGGANGAAAQSSSSADFALDRSMSKWGGHDHHGSGFWCVAAAETTPSPCARKPNGRSDAGPISVGRRTRDSRTPGVAV